MSRDDEREVLIQHYEAGSDNPSTNLNSIVGFLESILVNESFTAMQTKFCSKHAGMSNNEWVYIIN